jgi:hypothetical protein
MIPHLFFYQLAVLGLLWLCVMLHAAWPSRGAPAQGTPAQPIRPRRQRSKEPKPFVGLTHKPHCALCAQEAAHPAPHPPVRPDPILPPPAAPVRLTPRGISVHMPPVTIAAGWAWETSAPMAIPVVAHGDSSTAPPATANFWRPWHHLAWQTDSGGADRPGVGLPG